MVKLKVGQTHIVRLEKEGVGGYTWQPVPGAWEGGLEVAKCESQPDAPMQPGAPVMVLYCIKARERGKYKVVFHWRRAWEGSGLPAATVTVSIQVD